MIATIHAFLIDNAVILGSLASILAIVGLGPAVYRALTSRWRKPDTVFIANPEAFHAPKAIAPPPGTVQLDLDAFIALQTKLRDQARADLAKAHGEERQRLEDKIDALNQRLANPDEALAQQQAIINDLQAQLARRGNEIGGDDLTKAKAALASGDFTLARTLFETLAARTQPEVEANAAAAFALGQIAEAEIRWHDAARHYATAARLNPGFDSLEKASGYAGRSGDYAAAIQFSGSLISWARNSGTQEQLASALNEQGINLHRQGRFPEAEALYKQALQIDRATIGEQHPDYATRLNNLAGVVQAQGRFPEAEALYGQALAICREKLGDSHPNTQFCIRNYLGLLETHIPASPMIPTLKALLAISP